MATRYNGSNPDHIDAVAQRIRDGFAVAVPTETVYGLAADARNPDAIASIYRIKNRPTGHPLILHISSFDQLDDWAIDIPEVARQLAAQFWPGPLTLVLKKAHHVLDAVTGGHDTIAIRVPNHPVLLALLNRLDSALVAPSANPHLMLSPTSADHVYRHLGHLIPAILDGGPCTVGIESTILSLVDPTQPLILREGPIAVSALSAFLGIPVLKNTDLNIPSPGNMQRHYQPRTPLVIESTNQIAARLDAVNHKQISLLTITDFKIEPRPNFIQLPSTPEGYAAGLYAALHTLDAFGLTQILLEAPPTTWGSVWNRLTRMAPIKMAHLRPETRLDYTGPPEGSPP